MAVIDSLDKKTTTTGVRNAPCARWDPALETGIELLDRQHQDLFNQIRILLHHSKGDRVHETLKFMIAYTAKHFETEQCLHQETNYPQAAEHLDAHKHFAYVLGKLKRNYSDSGHDHAILMQLVRFFLDWLKEHIRNQDQPFVESFRQLGPLP